MFKQIQIMLVLVCLLILPNLAKAETSVFDVIASIPALKQGVAFSLADNNINYLSTVDLVKWKGFALEGGYAGAAKNTGDKLVAVVSYDLLTLKGKTTIPVLEWLEFRPGVWAGVGRIGGSNEIDFGVSATVISFDF